MAYVINRLNRNVIGQFKSDFNTEYNRAKNSYTKFNSCFMFNCSDAYITQMRKKIVDYYNTIGYLYNSLNDWWNAYNYNLNYVENSIIEKNSGLVTETSIKTAVKQLPSLRDFRFNLNSFTIPDASVANFNKVETVDKIENNVEGKTFNPLETYLDFVDGNINAIKGFAKDKTLDFISENETAANIAMGITNLGEIYSNAFEIGTEYAAYAIANYYSLQMKELEKTTGIEYNMQDDEFLQKVQEFVDKDYSGEAFDSFYKNNEFGKTIYENASIADEAREFQKQFEGIQESTMATTALAAVSVTEGLVRVGEKILDTGAYAVGAVASVVAPESGADEAISEFIEKELTTDHYDWLQDNTLLGAEIKEKAVAQDLVRGVGNAVGEIVGIVGISALTGGAVQPWAVAGVSGFGGGVEDAFQSGADYSEAGLYGLAVGGLDALQWYVGGAIQSSIKNKFARVAIDSGLNLADMPMRSEFKAAFLGDEYKNELLKNVNYDENGNQIANKTWDDLTFYEQCKLAYEADGGHAALITNGVLGTALSGVGEFSDIGKYFTKDNGIVSSVTSAFDQADIKIKDPSFSDLTLNLDELKYKKVGNVQYAADYLDANIKKFVYNDTNKFAGLNESIMENGLIHFTSENAANSILASQKIKASGFSASYGNKKAFLFNGVPDVGNIAVNLDGIEIKMVGVEIQPTWDVVSNSKLKVRDLADECITWDGDFDLSNQKVTKGYYCLFQEGDELVYKKVSKNFYDNYDNTYIGKQLKEFLSNKSNIKNIADDHLSTYVHKSTRSKVTDSLESAVKKVNDTKVTELSNVSGADITVNNTVSGIVDVINSRQPLLEQFKKSLDSFAGSQQSALQKFKKLFKTSSDKIELKKLDDTIRKYYPDMSKQEIQAFLTRLNEHGCTYVAMASSIFEQLDYNADLFYKKFGFDMYLPDGSLNHDQLILDIFSSMGTMVEVNYNKTSTVSYNSWSEALQDITGVNPNTLDNPHGLSIDSLSLVQLREFANKNKISIDADDLGNIIVRQFEGTQKIIGTPSDIARKLLGSDSNVSSEQDLIKLLNDNDIIAKISIGLDATKDGLKIFSSNSGDWINAYFKNNGIDMQMNVEKIRTGILDTEDLIKKLTESYNDGYSIEVSAINGKPTIMTDGTPLGWVTLGNDGSGHAMIFRGITKNNDIIVSSWGEHYLISAEFIDNLEFNLIKSVGNDAKSVINSLEDNLTSNILNSSNGEKLSFIDQIKSVFASSSKSSTSAVISPPPEYIKYVNDLRTEKKWSQLNEWGNQLGATPDIVQRTFDEKLVQIVNESDFGIRVDNNTLCSILKDGSFRNQFETGTTKGAKSLNSRLYVEEKLFNVPDDVAVSDRPVYGLLFPKIDSSDVNTINYYTSKFSGRIYGDTVVILKKDNVINSTTLTLGDSLEYVNSLSSTLASHPKYCGNNTHLFWNINSLDELQNANLLTLASGRAAYPEIQLHGSGTHSIDNIEKIIFLEEPEKKLVKLMEKKGISWEILPR